MCLLLAGSDFVAVVNTAMNVGTSPFPFNYTLVQDNLVETEEMFHLVLSIGVGVAASIASASGTATVTINDNDCKFADYAAMWWIRRTC